MVIVCRWIGDMALDIDYQLIDRMKQREFSLQLDEATDGSRDAHLINMPTRHIRYELNY